MEERKENIILNLVERRKNILEEATALPAGKHEEIFLGCWSIMDLLAHLIGWDYTNIQAVREILSNQVPGFFAFYDRDWRSYNQRLVTQYKLKDFTHLIEAVKKSHEELINLLRSLPAEEFYRDRGLRSGGYKVTIASLMQVELNDERKHHKQIVEFSNRE